MPAENLIPYRRSLRPVRPESFPQYVDQELDKIARSSAEAVQALQGVELLEGPEGPMGPAGPAGPEGPPGENPVGALIDTNNLSDVDDPATARSNLGLASGGSGDIWVEKSGDTMTGPLVISGAGLIVDTDALAVDATNNFVGIGTASPLRSIHARRDLSSVVSIAAFDNEDTTDGNGAVFSFRGATTGAGATSFFEFGAIRAQYTTHNHATAGCELGFFIRAAGAQVAPLVIAPGAVRPASNDLAALGTATLSWSDLFLASGAVINFANGNATVTHSSGKLTSSVPVAVPDAAYGAGWDGSLEVPTKNAVYDKIQTLVSGSNTDQAPSTAPPLLASWTQQNFDASTFAANITAGVDAARTGLRLTYGPATVGNVNSLRALLVAIPSTRWRVTARLRKQSPSSSFGTFGLVFRDSASSTSVTMGIVDEVTGFGYQKLNNDNSYNSVTGWNSGRLDGRMGDFWLQVEWNGTNAIVRISYDGWYFSQITTFTDSKFGFLTNATTHLGFGLSSNFSGAPALFQRTIDLLSWNVETLP
jgi:hypothetical protein